MTTPVFAKCLCGHSKQRHEGGLAPQCVAMGCNCLRYRPDVAHAPQSPPVVAVPPPRPAAPAPTETPRQPRISVIEAGKGSTNKSIVALANRIDQLLLDLDARLRQDAVKDAVRREVAELETRLAAAKEKLRPGAGQPGTGVCPDCGKPGLKSIGTHQFRAHGKTNPKGTK